MSPPPPFNRSMLTPPGSNALQEKAKEKAARDAISAKLAADRVERGLPPLVQN